MVKQPRNTKLRSAALINTALTLAILVALNFVSYFLFERFDLTADKRYTLGKITQDYLKELDDVVFVKIYLEGDLPPGFKRMQESCREMLDEFRVFAGDKIQYQFIDPSDFETAKERNDFFEQLYSQGVRSFELEDMRDDQIVQKVIFPGALFSYQGKTVPVTMLKEQMGLQPEVAIHNSIVGLEYEFAQAIKRLREPEKKKIAFLAGHGELSREETVDIALELRPFYDLERINPSEYKVGKLEQYDLLVIAKPRQEFHEADKYKIDQFIMHGGKVLWLVDALAAEMDSLRNGMAITYDYPINLADLLFKYGVRVNPNLVQDFNCHKIPIFAGENNRRSTLRPWPYYPLATPRSEHPVVRNSSTVWFRFASSIDTVGSRGIKKTVLLKSSENSRVSFNPVRINLQMVKFQLSPNLFSKGPQNLAVLLEGEFTSAFKNRLSAKTLSNPDYGIFKEKSPRTQQIVISDGDVIANHVSKAGGNTYPLGYDHLTRSTFGNKAFILNCIDYLVDDSGVFQLRSKDLKLRLLNAASVKEQRLKWQLLNLIVPVVLLVLFGFGYRAWRKRKFGKALS